MELFSKLKQWLLQDESESESTNITRQQIVDGIFEHFKERFKEETTTESMLFPTAFHVFMNPEDYEKRSQSFSNTVKDAVNKMKRYISQQNQKRKIGSAYIPHSKYWLFQFTAATEDVFIDGLPEEATALEPKDLFILSSIYPEDNDLAATGEQRMVGTLHIKNSFKMNNLAINPNAIIGLDILGKNRFRVPFTSLNEVNTMPTTEEQQKINKEKTKATLSIQQQQYGFFTDQFGSRAYSVNMLSDNIYISGKNAQFNNQDNISVIRINSEMVLNPHIQIKAENNGNFSILAFGTTRLNEQKMKLGEWTILPNNSTILLNDEIQILFKKK